MADLVPGMYRGRGIKGSPQWSDAGTGTLQLVVGLELKDKKTGEHVRSASTFLPFTDKAAAYSIERLRSLGWKGQTAADLENMDGIDTNEVDVEVRADNYQGKTSYKVEIVTGPGLVTVERPVDPKAAVARVAAMLGQKAPDGAGGVKPPF